MIRIIRRNDPRENRHTTEEALTSLLVCLATEEPQKNGGKVVELR